MSNYKKYLETYKFKRDLPGKGDSVEIRSLTTNDMKKLLVYENTEDPLLGEEILDVIINNSVLTEDFDINNLYSQDRYFLFIELRKITKGSKYSFTYDCPKCKSQTIQNIDLNNLKITNMPKDIQKELSLVDGNIILEMSFMTRGRQKEMLKCIDDKLPATEKQIEMILANMAASVVSVTTPEGVEEIPPCELIQFIGDLPRTEYDKISEWYDNHNFGIDLTIKINCISCGYEQETQMPLDNFFD